MQLPKYDLANAVKYPKKEYIVLFHEYHIFVTKVCLLNDRLLTTISP